MCFFFFKFISLSTVAELRSFDGVGDGDNTEFGLERERVSTLLPLSRFLFFSFLFRRNGSGAVKIKYYGLGEWMNILLICQIFCLSFSIGLVL